MSEVFCDFLLHLGAGVVMKVLAIWQVLVLGSDEAFLPANQNEHQNI